jgi:hypothetical protein
MTEAVVCLVSSSVEADAILSSLQEIGFSNSDISILMPDKNSVRDLGHENTTKAPEGATAGASTGAVIGGALGWLAGIGSLAIPGLGPFIAAGPIMAALSGAAIGGTVGGVSGALIGLGLPEYEAKQYENKLRDGNILVSVHTEDGEEAKRAEQIFKSGHAREIRRVNEEKVNVHR